jgi:hypothetical protein
MDTTMKRAALAVALLAALPAAAKQPEPEPGEWLNVNQGCRRISQLYASKPQNPQDVLDFIRTVEPKADFDLRHAYTGGSGEDRVVILAPKTYPMVFANDPELCRYLRKHPLK